MRLPFVTPDDIRTRFSRAMSDMYQAEVPQYGTLLEIVAQTNAATMASDPALKARLEAAGEIGRLNLERHGAIRLGTAEELATMARVFGVMGMVAVGYYDLSVAGIPVHSTAFRPVDDAALAANPFRVFTSLLRLELIKDEALREEARAILAARDIFTPRLRALLDLCDTEGGLEAARADEFVAEALETFRWHEAAPVSLATYQRMHDAHRLIADVVCFRGPHINHLTPRTLDIDRTQDLMPAHGISPKDTIEGPPERRVMILLRQTSFKALEEQIRFADGDGTEAAGTHTARFGEIEQRGVALTPKGRALYDRLLGEVMARTRKVSAEEYNRVLHQVFAAFPDEEAVLYAEDLAYFRYVAAPGADRTAGRGKDLAALIGAGLVTLSPIVYEDFLPVSAAGIFQSNLGEGGERDYGDENAAEREFIAALGATPLDPFAMYEAARARSAREVLAAFA
ncbi:2-oxoadipate dioxygenase/decarboxylase HglS [Falsigemmobacter faecalis]|uniref:2-oxoadipate dioxygenase/decarboxylase n=1 Tax=Falsigemmobacter faecalis TaxID=2488730 RepID=A0A3P3DVF8_9RHOB|nr:VOC family protein [Falsigemmobacter faecalis]RRH78155.1 VOC family protein [Falsigemmobacter faecalis]